MWLTESGIGLPRKCGLDDSCSKQIGVCKGLRAQSLENRFLRYAASATPEAIYLNKAAKGTELDPAIPMARYQPRACSLSTRALQQVHYQHSSTRPGHLSGILEN